MRGSYTFALTTLWLLLSLWVVPSRGQGLPQASPNAKACAYLPVAELEAHFGAKAQNMRGLDLSTQNTCTAQFPDGQHVGRVESHPSSAADIAMSAAQRLDFVRQADKKVETRDFGSVGCFRTSIDLGKPVPVTTCFLAKTAYLAFTLQSPDAAQVSYEATRSLLEKAAARRK